jgi:hypothetical protein
VGPASFEGEGRRPRRTLEARSGTEAIVIWVFTQDGFYSVTAYDEAPGGPRPDANELVVVRTRARDDLTRLSGWIHDAEIVATPSADYPFRIVCGREEWARYLVAMTEQIDYTNFKQRVEERLGTRRHDVLLSVWTTLRRLETDAS